MCFKSFHTGSKNQDAGNTSGADQSPNGFADQPDQHDLQTLQNHNLLIALGAAQQSPGARHFAMPVSPNKQKIKSVNIIKTKQKNKNTQCCF